MELKHELAQCIDGFREELRQLLRRAIDVQVSQALEKARIRREASERAARLREEKARAREDSLTIELRRRGKHGTEPLFQAPAAQGTKRRGKRGSSALLEENGDARIGESASAAAAPQPAPLFVHKRLRTGEIRELTRSPGDSSQP
jgi:hypothetical protein